MDQRHKTMVSFAGSVEKNKWLVVNDGVMGGLSRSSFDINPDNRALFCGDVSLENSGGFASVRRLLDLNLGGCQGVELDIKGDGRTYQFRLRTSLRFDDIAYRAEFVTEPEQWITLKLPFASFEPTFRGRIVPDAPILDPAKIKQIGFLIADRQQGAFCLEIKRIRAY